MKDKLGIREQLPEFVGVKDIYTGFGIDTPHIEVFLLESSAQMCSDKTSPTCDDRYFLLHAFPACTSITPYPPVFNICVNVILSTQYGSSVPRAVVCARMCLYPARNRHPSRLRKVALCGMNLRNDAT